MECPLAIFCLTIAQLSTMTPFSKLSRGAQHMVRYEADTPAYGRLSPWNFCDRALRTRRRSGPFSNIPHRLQNVRATFPRHLGRQIVRSCSPSPHRSTHTTAYDMVAWSFLSYSCTSCALAFSQLVIVLNGTACTTGIWPANVTISSAPLIASILLLRDFFPFSSPPAKAHQRVSGVSRIRGVNLHALVPAGFHSTSPDFARWN